jgi:flagellar hook assembly protein FlgD
VLLAVWLAPRVSAQVRDWAAFPPVRAVTMTLTPGSDTAVAPASSPAPDGLRSLLQVDDGRSTGGAAPRIAAAGVTLEPGIRFNMVGFVYGLRTGALPRLRYRVHTVDGNWSAWRPVDFSLVRGRDGTLRTVAEPLWAGTSDGLQVRGDRAAAVRATFINVLGDATAGDRVSGVLRRAALAVTGLMPAGEAAAATDRPPIVTRKQWGADESWRSGSPRYGEVKFSVVHHTVGGNTYTREQAASVMRAVYYYHARVCKFSDIGYNFLIDRYGTIYEGRYGGIDKAVMGAQALGFNGQSTGVSLMGDFRAVAPPTAAVAALEQFLAWKLDQFHIDPSSRVSAYCSDTDKFKGGATVKVPAISGHREVCNTDCPGDTFHGMIPTIRKVVADTGLPKIYGYNATPAVISPNGDGWGDQTQIEFIASETVDWIVTVTTEQGVPVRTLTGNGQTVSAPWDGLDDAGVPVLDGAYWVTANASGPSGVATEGRVKVVADTVLPALALQPVTPAVVNPEGGVLDTSGKVAYSITEPCSVKAVVRDQAGAALHAVQGWQSQATGEHTISWDGRTVTGGKRVPVQDGVYALEVTARDAAGNRAVQTVPLTIDRTVRLGDVPTQYISPNGDGVADAATLAFTLAKPVKVQITASHAGKAVLTQALGRLAAGERQATWDGRDGNGATAVDGAYLLTLAATSDGSSSRAGAKVVVDTTRPQIVVGKAVTIKRGKTAVTACTVGDKGSPTIAVKVVVRDGRKRVVKRLETTAKAGRAWTFSFVPPRRGRFTVTFTAVDRAGNPQAKAATWKVRVR